MGWSSTVRFFWEGCQFDDYFELQKKMVAVVSCFIGGMVLCGDGGVVFGEGAVAWFAAGGGGLCFWMY